MNRVLQMFLICCLLFFLVFLFRYLGKKKLNLKYSLAWLISGLFMLIITIFPQLVNYLGKVVGVVDPVNTVFLFTGMFTILILMTLTFIISHMNNRIYKMAQAIALLEYRLHEIEDAKCPESEYGVQ